MIVPDVFVVATWALPDEQSRTDVLDRISQGEEIVVPPLWAFEVMNVLLIAERRGRISTADVESFIGILSALPVQVDPLSFNVAWADTKVLARAHSLTAYDAAYLELAIRKGAVLATEDTELIAAARVHNVTIL